MRRLGVLMLVFERLIKCETNHESDESVREAGPLIVPERGKYRANDSF
jgi:hypothetical protein